MGGEGRVVPSKLTELVCRILLPVWLYDMVVLCVSWCVVCRAVCVLNSNSSIIYFTCPGCCLLSSLEEEVICLLNMAFYKFEGTELCV